MLLPRLNGSFPRYFIFGPLVFSVATEDLVESMVGGKNGKDVYDILTFVGSPMLTRRSEGLPKEGEELVVVPSPLFPHELSLGYPSPQYRVVKAINGLPVENLRQLVETIRDSRDQFISIEFEDLLPGTIVLPREGTLGATDQILNDNGIRYQGTPDILEAWKAEPQR
jgi:hypothetical protein